jgi:hypothetical protein
MTRERHHFNEPPTDPIERLYEEGHFADAMRGTGVNRNKKVDNREPAVGSMKPRKSFDSKRVESRKKHKEKNI